MLTEILRRTQLGGNNLIRVRERKRAQTLHKEGSTGWEFVFLLEIITTAGNGRSIKINA